MRQVSNEQINPLAAGMGKTVLKQNTKIFVTPPNNTKNNPMQGMTAYQAWNKSIIKISYSVLKVYDKFWT